LHYAQISRQIREILLSFTPLIEPSSLDEAFLDVRGCEGLFGPAPVIAKKIKTRIKNETGLTASIGVAPNKFLAKLASDLRKPDGLVIITPENLDATLTPLSIGKIWGIGAKTAARLEAIGVKTIGDLRKLSLDTLQRRVGDAAEHFRRLALGLDDRPVVSDREAKSIGQEQTFGENLVDPQAVRDVM